MKLITSLTLALIFFNGCTPKLLLMDEKQESFLKGKTITMVKQVWPKHIELNTIGKGLGYVVGGVLGSMLLSLDNERADGIEIPGNYIAKKITPLIANKYQMNFINEQRKEHHETVLETLNKTKKVPELEQFRNDYKSDYLLDIYTYTWLVTYTKWYGGASYVVVMRNDLRLIERETKKVISTISCEYLPKYKKGLPTSSEMFENNGKLIKEETLKASNLCIEKIKKNLLQ